jgi:hypothetical protein
MSIESMSDQDLFLHYANWALDTGLWNGREIDPSGVNAFKDAVVEKIVSKLFSQDEESYAFQKMAADLAFVGARQREDEEIIAELVALQAFQNGGVIPAGFCKSVKKFWKKHKVEILVGIAVVAVITAVAVGALCVAGAAAAGGAMIPDESKKAKEPSAPEPQPTETQSAFEKPSVEHHFSRMDLSLNKDEVYFNGKSLAYNDALEPKTIAGSIYEYYDDLYKQGQDNPFFQSRKIPNFLPKENATSSGDLQIHEPPTFYRDIPVYSSKNLPPVTDKTSWVFRMIDWGLSDNNDAMTDPMPVLENASSQVFRTLGEQRKDLAVFGINGINTSLHESIHHAEYLAQFTKGLSVTWVHNHSNGALVDIGECIAVNFPGASPNTKNLERDQWIAFHKANLDNPKAKCLHFCHSQGAIHTKNALQSVPKEIRERVIIVAIAPAAIITDDQCYKAYNYASKLDKVYLAEMMSHSLGDLERAKQALEALEHLILLEPHEGATGLDHNFESPTFLEPVCGRLQQYLQSMGVE